MEDHRVCSLIKYLNYKDLTKYLPKEKLFTTVECRGGSGSKNLSPTLAKKLGPINYGLFVEKMIEILLMNNYNVNCLAVIKQSLPSDLQANFKYEDWKDLASLLKSEFGNKRIELQKEMLDVNTMISGHPDVMTDTIIYDIKTTGRFGAMRIHCIFQLLSYYCLSQIKKLPITHVGLILPLQSKIVKYNLSKWQWKPFYNALCEAITEKLVQACLWDIDDFIQDIFYAQMNQHVGYHCHNDDLSKCMSKNVPALQFFVNGNVTGVVSYSNKLVNDLKTLTKSKVFIHSPYILNLSHPGKKGRAEYDLGDASYGGWTFNCLTKLLQFARDTNIKGVVVHLGKTCGESYDESVFNMYFSVIACSAWATKECKLLLETSCDQNGEILANPHELADFYLSLPDCVRGVVGICVDTAHTCAAGYNGFEFIQALANKKVPIDLIHYNDSKGKCGCKKDRHAMIGDGYLGYDTLNAVLQYGILHDIPMLTE